MISGERLRYTGWPGRDTIGFMRLFSLYMHIQGLWITSQNPRFQNFLIFKGVSRRKDIELTG
ncbi:MAG: hypothetical protein KBB23_11715 [Smithella sp.]|jgi:hypothetical protein|nr:hypothetical protein [Smithella sp.]